MWDVPKGGEELLGMLEARVWAAEAWRKPDLDLVITGTLRAS